MEAALYAVATIISVEAAVFQLCWSPTASTTRRRAAKTALLDFICSKGNAGRAQYSAVNVGDLTLATVTLVSRMPACTTISASPTEQRSWEPPLLPQLSSTLLPEIAPTGYNPT